MGIGHEQRDDETGNHIRRTQHYVRALAERLRGHPRFHGELDGETIPLLYKSAPLHDVGKVAIPDAILFHWKFKEKTVSMTEPRFRIFVVDDEPSARQVLAFYLDDPHYEVAEFASGEALLAALDQAPDLILLDVEMPGMSGIETCRRLREQGNDHALVTFISGHDDLDTRLAAYDAGSSDYMLKPFTEAELIRKVRVAEQILQQRQGMVQEADFAQRTAFSAMSSLGETGTVLAFLRNSFASRTPAELAAALNAAAEEFGLALLLGLCGAEGRGCFSGAKGCTPLEQSILEYAAGKGRISQSRDCLVVNYPRITLVATGLPLDDPDRVGRLRDHLAILAEGADARLASLENEHRRLAQAAVAVSAAAELSRALDEIERSREEHRLAAIAAGDDYLEELENAFLHLGLSEPQEAALIEMAQQTVGRTAALLEDDHALSVRLLGVVDQLRELTHGGAVSVAEAP